MNKLQTNSKGIQSQRKQILELGAQGHNIVTHWEIIHTSKGKHRIAKYVLFAGGDANG